MHLFQRFCRPQSYSCCSVQACFLHTHAKMSSRRLDWLLHQIEDLIKPKYARSEHIKLLGRQDNVFARADLLQQSLRPNRSLAHSSDSSTPALSVCPECIRPGLGAYFSCIRCSDGYFRCCHHPGRWQGPVPVRRPPSARHLLAHCEMHDAQRCL